MARHQHIINLANGFDLGDGPICSLCKLDPMTSQHILGECGALNEIRFKHFGCFQLEPPFTALKKSALVGFLREAPVDELRFFIEVENI